MLRNFIRNQKKCLSTAFRAKTKIEASKKPSKKANTSATNTKMIRNWKNLRQKTDQDSPNSTNNYTLMSYNILAQDLLTEHMHLYMNTDVRWLKWEHRLQCLSNEITEIKPDIICLQEMQFNHLKGLVKQIRGNRKLEYIFKKKTGHRTDGCAIIYDKTKFKLLNDKVLEYYTEEIRTLNREQIAIMAKFLLKNSNGHETEKQVVVATTHLLYNPRREDVRMDQINVLLKGLHEFSCSSNTKEPHLPVILTGDFNLEPNSPGFKLLHAPFMKMCQLSSNSQHWNPLEMLGHNFGNEQASTFQDRWKTVDFILHSLATNKSSGNKIKIWSIYQLPSVGQCMKSGAIPNRSYGSDHYSLAVLFSVCN